MSRRSKRYQKLKEKIEKPRGGIFSIKEAISKIKKSASAKFDESVEVHIRLGLDQKGGTQVIRGAVDFPKDIGKKRRIAAFVPSGKVKEAKKAGADIAGGKELIQKIKESKKIDFDLALAESQMMRSLVPIAKILGQKGLMPSPKSGTVAPDIIPIISEFSKGKFAFKSDEQGVIHQIIGKAPLSVKDLLANYQVLIKAVKKQTPENQKGEFIKAIYVCSTMGPSLAVKG